MFLLALVCPMHNLIRLTIDSEVKFIAGAGLLPPSEILEILPFWQLGRSTERRPSVKAADRVPASVQSCFPLNLRLDSSLLLDMGIRFRRIVLKYIAGACHHDYCFEPHSDNGGPLDSFLS